MPPRPRFGIIALLLLIAAGVLIFTQFKDAELWQAACMRVGLLMGAIWLAHPHLSRVHPKVMAFICIVAAAVLIFAAKHPFQMALMAVIALVLGYFHTHSWRRQPRAEARRS